MSQYAFKIPNIFTKTHNLLPFPYLLLAYKLAMPVTRAGEHLTLL